jgi:hypothetical protein
MSEIARTLGAVGVESTPAPDELWARSRPVTRTLSKRERKILAQNTFEELDRLSWTGSWEIARDDLPRLKSTEENGGNAASLYFYFCC